MYLSGLYVASRLHLPNDAKSLNLAVGYVLTQLLFLFGIYISNAYYSLYFLLFLFVLMTLFSLPLLKKEVANINLKILGIVLLLLFLVGFNFIYFGLNSYWHTASEDCFDAINGKDYIIGNIHSLKDFMLNEEAVNNFINQRGDIHSFLYSDVVLQYTTVTFFSLLFDTHGNFDSFLIQATINLLMMFLGILLLCKKIFGFSYRLSFLIAFMSVYSNLYYTTYINTHEGSMIFGAVMPFVLYLFFKLDDAGFKDKKLLFLLALFSVFLFLTYKHPYLFFLIPAFAYVFKEKIKYIIMRICHHKLTLVPIVLSLVAFLFYLYGVYDHYVDFRDSRFRSWGISLEPEMLLVYWGMVHSQVTNIGSASGFVYNNLALKYGLYFLSSIFTMISLYGMFVFSKKHIYFRFFVFFWVLFFLFFKFVLGDSYYFYKFLYTTQFVFILFLFVGLKELLNKKFLKTVSVFLASVFIIVNISYNIFSNYLIVKAPQNVDNNSYQTIHDIPKDILTESYLDIPKQYLKQIVQYNLRQDGLATKFSVHDAEYIIFIKGSNDIYFSSYKREDAETVFENSTFQVIKKPKGYISLYGPWEPEQFSSNVGNFSDIPFRWMSHDISSGKIYIYLKTNKKYLQACFESGPSIGFGEFDINFDDQKYIIKGVECRYFELADNKEKYQMYSTVNGKKLLPFDERSLEYKIAAVQYTDLKYDRDVLAILNPKNDVVNQDFEKSNNIVLGNGWYPQEAPNMRWGSDGLELLVLNTTKDNLDIEFDIEPGPTLKELPLRVEILNSEDQKIGYFESQSKGKVVVNIPVKPNQRYQILKLKVLNETKKIPQDPRDLNLRLFSVRVVK